MKNALIHKWASKSHKRFIDRDWRLLAKLIFNLAVFSSLRIRIRELIFDFFSFVFLTTQFWPSNLLYHRQNFSHLPLFKYFYVWKTREENFQINQVTACRVRNETLKNNKESFVEAKSYFKRSIFEWIKNIAASRSTLKRKTMKKWWNTFNLRQVQHFIAHPKLIAFHSLFYGSAALWKFCFGLLIVRGIVCPHE